jgi:uncharacterized membrane protein YoaK (UPF0700 family)
VYPRQICLFRAKASVLPGKSGAVRSGRKLRSSPTGNIKNAMKLTRKGQDAARHTKLSNAVSPSSFDHLCAETLLLFVLSVIAGSVDVIGFLGLNALFTSHITGNLVVLAAEYVNHERAPVASVIAVPIFVVALVFTRLAVAALERAGFGSLLPLLSLQLFLLASAAVCVTGLAYAEINAMNTILAGMLVVSAMAVQNALVRVSLTGAPSSAVMTTNVTKLTMDVGEILFHCNSRSARNARDRASRTWPPVAGFLLGCAFGGPAEASIGLRALMLPAALALLALGVGFAVVSRHRILAA